MGNLLPENRNGIQNIERSQFSVLDDFVVKISLCQSYNTVLNSGYHTQGIFEMRVIIKN